MRVVVGRIGRPHGVRGEVTVEPRTDEPDERFAAGSSVEVAGSTRQLVVESAHWHSGRLLVAFAGVNDRDAAEALRNSILEIERDPDEAPDDPEEFYDSALVGCEVALIDGDVVGTVREVLHLPAQDLLSITTPDDREVLVPFVAAMVPTVDVAQRRIVIDPPPGLLDAEA